MICPSCSEEMEPVGADIAPPLAICPACETSIVVGDALRIARASDTAVLTPDQLSALKKLRKNTRAARAEYFKQHHA